MDPSSIGKPGNKVDDSGASRKVANEPATSPAGDTSNKASTSDTVNLTSSAQLLERLEKSLASLPDIDVGRVEEVKLALQSGDYEIDADAIADAMIRFERSFGE